MGTLSTGVWWGGTLLLAAVLGRMAWNKLMPRFAFFSAYLAAVLTSSLVLLFLRPATSYAYLIGYWVSEMVTVALSFGITWEIYTEALSPYPGMRKLARTLLRATFAVVGAKAAVGLWGNPSLTAAIIEFERDLRVLQALLLLALLGLVAHYALPLGRNVRCLLIGYGLYLGIRVATLNELFQMGLLFRPWVSLISQCGWVIAAAIWGVGMWSCSSSAPEVVESFDCDYEYTSQRTIAALGQLRQHLVHSWRSS